VLLAADPDVRTHQAFGLPKIRFVADGTDPAELHWPERATMAQFLAPQFNPHKRTTGRQNDPQAMETSTKKDGFEPTEADQQIVAAHFSQLTGHFLIDTQGTIRWSRGRKEGPNDLLNFPSDSDILAAVVAISRWRAAPPQTAIPIGGFPHMTTA
jgi:hypothetical protein